MLVPSKLTVELIDKSSNPTIREMFADAQASSEINRFAATHSLHLQTEYISGTPSGFVLTGTLPNLQAFIKQFLAEDSERGVYSLLAS